MVVSTYQSVSGAGQVGMHELDAQWTKLAGRSGALACGPRAIAGVVEARCGPKPIAGNVIPLAGSVKEERLHVGGVEDGARDAQDPPRRRDPRAPSRACACPVYVGHAVTRQRAVPPADVARPKRSSCCATAPGVRLVDDGDGYPTPLEAAGIDPVLVGRLREDPSEPGSLDLWVTGDNLRKGAALNAVQMAELLLALSPGSSGRRATAGGSRRTG